VDAQDESEVLVGNVWIDRSGRDRSCHVNVEPLNMDVIAEATEWLTEVVWAFTNDEEARKEPSKEVCATTCGFYIPCRSFDGAPSGLITDPELIAATEMYREGVAMESKGGKLKDQAKEALNGISGSTGKHLVRWVKVSGSTVTFDRAPYERLSITATGA
jgi:hypothetical protein